MKGKLLFAILFSLLFLSPLTSNSQTDERRWIQIDPRSTSPVDNNSTLTYNLPMVQEDFVPGPVTYRYEITPNGVFAVSSSARILPRTSSQSEVIITRHPLNPDIMFASANVYPVYGGRFSEGVYVTTNFGASWFGKDSLAGAPVDMHVGDPAPIIDKNGTFIMTHLRLDYSTGSLTGMDANYSTNNGSTWSNSVTLLAGTQDKNMATTDDAPGSSFYGRSYCVWSRFTAGAPPIVISYTTNGGVSWSAATDINVSAAGHYSQGADARVGPNGELYVCWANPTGSGSFTEDFCGFAKSTTGGTSWVINNNNVFDMNGIRGTLPTVNNIRVNSFPRIDVDRTCGPRSGWIYIVVSQRNLAPAGTDADIVIHRSTDGGTTWSGGIKVNQDALNNGKLQYFPCVRVDESGAVNVFYYDNRNTVAPVMQNFLSRSTDGGTTWTDIKVTDHNFTPSPIAGTATGYQGDYIGITSGKDKIFCNWMDNSTGTYQSWIANVDITIPGLCENFSCSTFPPSTMTEEFTGSNYWSRQTQSAYGIGSGSARFQSAAAIAGTVQTLTSYGFPAVPANTSITLDVAYAPWSVSFPGPDTLQIQSSTNNGASYSIVHTMLGKLDGTGELNTAPPLGTDFVPTASQWRSKIYPLPTGTNRIRVVGRSGYGNDIWVDNVCVQTLNPPVIQGVGIAAEGMWVSPVTPWRLLDTVRVYLYRTDFPNIAVDSSIDVVNTNSVIQFVFDKALSGTYYKVIKHRNTIETWSRTGGEAYTRGSNVHFNFLTPVGQAYDNNQKLVDPFPYYAMFSGDINKDHVINLVDKLAIANDFSLFVTGYVRTDVTGDNVTNLNDLIVCHNNDQNFVSRHAPPGAVPLPNIITYEDSNNMKFENDAHRHKYESSRKVFEELQLRDQQDKLKKESEVRIKNENDLKSKKRSELLRKYFEANSLPSDSRGTITGQ